MKYLLLIGFSFWAIMSCGDNSKTTTEKTPPSVSNDSTEIAATIHGFFTWYDALQRDTTKPFDITNTKVVCDMGIK